MVAVLRGWGRCQAGVGGVTPTLPAPPRAPDIRFLEPFCLLSMMIDSFEWLAPAPVTPAEKMIAATPRQVAQIRSFAG